MSKTITIAPAALTVLRQGSFTENPSGFVFVLPSGLDRPLYDAVNKALTAAGGKWNKKAGGHVFANDPRPTLGVAIETGKIANRQQTLQLFPTPPEIARQMAQWLDVMAQHRTLEPSAGTGRLLDAIPAPDVIIAVEKDAELATALKQNYRDVAVVNADFLTWSSAEPFDRIIMNPPFERGDDIRHIEHALAMLAPGGRLVALCAAGPKQRAAFEERALRWELLPAKSFKAEGTAIDIALLVMDAEPTTEQLSKEAV